jgi:hemolysin D
MEHATLIDAERSNARRELVAAKVELSRLDALIPNRDVGYVHVGQEVSVKLETFIFTRYGLITGKVRVLSGDAVDDPKQGPVYPARIALDRTSLMVEGRETPVTPGMAATVEIKTGERRLIDYVLTPLLKTTQEAMRER